MHQTLANLTTKIPNHYFLKKAALLTCVLLVSTTLLCQPTRAESSLNQHENLVRQAEAGDAKAQYALGMELYSRYDVDEAYDWIQRAAKQNHTDAMHLLGMMRFIGLSTPSDLDNAVYWMKKAAAKNDKKSIERLVAFNEIEQYIGADVSNNWQVTTRMLVSESTLKAVQGDAAAQMELSVMYYSGFMVSSIESFPKNQTRARYWRDKAVAQNYARAQLAVASDLYWRYIKNNEDGKSQSISNLENAVKWLKLSLSDASVHDKDWYQYYDRNSKEWLPQLEQELKTAREQLKQPK